MKPDRRVFLKATALASAAAATSALRPTPIAAAQTRSERSRLPRGMVFATLRRPWARAEDRARRVRCGSSRGALSRKCARDGATRERLAKIAEVAMRAWPKPERKT